MSAPALTSTPSTPAFISLAFNNVLLTVNAEGLYIDATEFGRGALDLDHDDALALIAVLARPAVRRLLQRYWAAQQHREHLERVVDDATK